VRSWNVAGWEDEEQQDMVVGSWVEFT
jgi:hypothetical protein